MPLDFGCRPVVTEEPDGTLSVGVFVTEGQAESLRNEGYEVSIREMRAENEPRPEVGEGDRFQGGRIPLEGLGVKVHDEEEPGA
ncbi:hypothetical protein [Streptomyces mirabilis]|uniref:hypothetical protein n=1 Tax=Streptomyces mirabilis TaxID=68239 RepID=UPI0033300AE4